MKSKKQKKSSSKETKGRKVKPTPSKINKRKVVKVIDDKSTSEKGLLNKLRRENNVLKKRNELLLRSCEFSQSIIATIHEPLLVLDNNFRIKSANKSFYEKFLVNEESIENMLLFDFGDGQWNIPKLKELLSDVLSKNLDFKNFTLTHDFSKSGGKNILLLNAHYIIQKTSSRQLILLAIEDITERSNYYLQEKALLKREKEIAEEAMKAKQRFLSNMSHEIRTPMNAIIGFTNVMLRTNLDDKQRDYLNAIKISGDNLIVLINDILDLAKVDAGKMSFQEIPFKLSTSVSSMLHLFETKIMEKGIELVKQYDEDIPEILIGDSVRLHQIILNLISNAIKFTSRGRVTVSVRLLDENEEKVTVGFAVTDTGIGIPENRLLSIFDAFQQASGDISGTYGGTGLGLTIVKQLVEAQKGTIAVKSILGQGSNFSFILTFKKAPIGYSLEENNKVGRKNHLSSNISHAKKIKILVVEDMKFNQMLMKTILEDFGFHIDLAENGKIAIDKISETNYDIILMDLHLPVMNGFDATQYIRNKIDQNVPIIALTADVTTIDFEMCKAIGMNDYITKPINEELLYNVITKYIDGSIKKRDLKIKVLASDEKNKIVDLDNLEHFAKGNSKIMLEMINVYLEETPQLLNSIKLAIEKRDWESLRMATHSIMPSFATIGVKGDAESLVAEMHDHAIRLKDNCKLNADELSAEISVINNLRLKLEKNCAMAEEKLKQNILFLSLE